MKKILLMLAPALIIALLVTITGCVTSPKTTQSNEEAIVGSFLQALSNDDISACLSLVSDDIVFRQVG